MIAIASQNQGITPPFLKWAGGKRWLLKYAAELFPEKIGTYYEPFLGSAAVFFNLNPDEAVLSDVNSELIDTYIAIQRNPKLVYSHLKKHQNLHSKEHYYAVRKSKPQTLVTRAARLIYLNRTCWNGLYRVNLNGKFNVPKGTKEKVVLDTDDFESVSRRLSGKELLNQDFEITIDRAKKGDFVFADPPYTVMHNNNGFLKYNDNIFEWKDQVRLKCALQRASDRGVKVLLSNAAHSSVIELYKNFGRHTVVTRSSLMAGDANHRKNCEELLIKCY